MRFRENEEEDRIQAEIFDLIAVGVDRDDVKAYALANGGKRDIRTAVKLKATGVMKGLADIMLLSRSRGKAFFMEVKTETGSLRKDQRDFRDFCIAAGIPWALVRSRDEAQRQLWSWGLLKPEFGGGPLVGEAQEAA